MDKDPSQKSCINIELQSRRHLHLLALVSTTTTTLCSCSSCFFRRCCRWWNSTSFGHWVFVSWKHTNHTNGGNTFIHMWLRHDSLDNNCNKARTRYGNQGMVLESNDLQRRMCDDHMDPFFRLPGIHAVMLHRYVSWYRSPAEPTHLIAGDSRSSLERRSSVWKKRRCTVLYVRIQIPRRHDW